MYPFKIESIMIEKSQEKIEEDNKLKVIHLYIKMKGHYLKAYRY